MKKILALCLTVMLVLAMVPVIGVAAADEKAITVKAVSSATEVKAGDQFTVDIVIEKNTGFNSLKLDVKYDSDVVKIAKNNDKKAGAGFTGVAFGPNKANPIAVNFVDSINYATTTTGTFASITFTVLDAPKAGDSAIEIQYEQKNVFAYDFEENADGDLIQTAKYDVPVTVVNTFVTVPCPHTNTTTTPAVEATCVVEGNGEYVTCNDCKKVIKGSADKAVNANNHKNTETTPAKEATCVTMGHVEYVTCKDCKKVVKGSADEALNANNHKNTVVTDAVPSTCKVQGNGRYVTCTDCDKVVEGSDAKLPLADHDIELKNAVAHTDTVDGYTGDKVCKACGETIEAGKVITAGHKKVDVAAKDATCDEAGNTAHWACSECDKIFGKETVTDADIIDADSVVVKAKGHTLSKVEKVAATADKDGVEEHWACADCDKIYKDKDGKTETTLAELTVKYEAPKTEEPKKEESDKPAENGDKKPTAPNTSDVVTVAMAVVFAALVASAAVVILKKKA